MSGWASERNVAAETSERYLRMHGTEPAVITLTLTYAVHELLFRAKHGWVQKNIICPTACDFF
jgi:hypothetical protein